MAASVGGIVAGKAFVLIEAIDKTGTMLAKVGKRFKDWGDSLSSVGRDLMTKGLFAAAPIGLATKTFMGFDDAMRRVEARSSGTADEMKNLRDQAKELGRTTSSTAQQIGDMMGNLAQKGFSRAQIFDMIPNVRNLAQAAGTGDPQADAVNAADLVSGSIRAFGFQSSDSGMLADVFATAVNASNFSLQGLVDAMATAAPIAKQYNLSVEQTVATLAGMTNVNIGAAESGIAFRNMLLNTSNAAKRADFNMALFAETGKQIEFVDAAGNLRPLPLILDEVGKAMKGVGSATRGQLFETLFGKRAITGANAVAEAMANSTDGFGSLLEKLENSGGNAAKTAQLMDAGIGGAFRRFMSAVEGVALSIGESLAPALTWIGDAIGNNLANVTEWIELNRGVILSVAGITVGVIALGGALTVLGGVVGAVGSALTVLGVLLSVGGGIPAAIVGITAGVLLFSQWDTISQGLVGTLGTLSETLGGVMDALQIGDFTAAWEIGIIGLKLAWMQFSDSIMDSWGNVSLFFRESWAGTMMFFETLWIKAQAKITDGILALGEQVMDFIGKIPGAEKLLGKGGMTSADFAKAREFAREDYQRRITGVQDETGQSISAYRKTQQDANAGREFEIDNERKALDAKLAAIEERRLLAQTDQYAADFASAMGAGLAVPGGAISPASLPGMPGGAGAAGAGMVDSGIRVTANEAIERGSMAAAKLDSEQYVRDLAGEQLSALEQIVRNTDPANQVGDEGEGV